MQRGKESPWRRLQPPLTHGGTGIHPHPPKTHTQLHALPVLCGAEPGSGLGLHRSLSPWEREVRGEGKAGRGSNSKQMSQRQARGNVHKGRGPVREVPQISSESAGWILRRKA